MLISKNRELYVSALFTIRKAIRQDLYLTREDLARRIAIAMEDEIKNAILNGLGDFKIYGILNTNDIIKICTEYDDGIIVGECKVSLTLGGLPSNPASYSSSTFVQPTNVNKKFVLDANNIYIKHP